MALRLSRKFLPWIAHHAFEFKWFYSGAFICLYLLQILGAELPERIRILTRTLGQHGTEGLTVWIFVGLALGIFVFRTLSRLLFFYPARVQQKLLRMELIHLLEQTPPSRYQGRGQGQLFQILFDDINNLRAFIGFGLLQIGNLAIAAWVLIPKINESDSYLWPAFTPLFLSVIFFSVTTLINQKIFKKMMQKKGEVQEYIIEAYEAKQTIKNFHREESFVAGFVRNSSEELSLFFKSAIAYAFTGPYIKLGLGASLLWGGILIRARSGEASDLVYFSGFLYLFLEPVMFLSWVAVVISQGYAAWGRVKELYSALEVPGPEEGDLKENTPQITESGVSVRLPFWAQSLEIQFKTSHWTIIVGETGSGKSHILSLLASSLRLHDYQVSMVQQNPYLFNDTIRGNIFLGRDANAVDEIEAKELISVFQLDVLAESLDDVLNLEVGENGKRLSGGQMKRVALIRSMMSGARIMIWDDPFSSVDVILEKRIISIIKKNPKWNHLTFILSTHRLTTVKFGDSLIYLDRNQGIKFQGEVGMALKEEHVQNFFKEQFMEVPLA